MAACNSLEGGKVPVTAGTVEAGFAGCDDWQPEAISAAMKRVMDKAVRSFRGFMTQTIRLNLWVCEFGLAGTRLVVAKGQARGVVRSFSSLATGR